MEPLFMNIITIENFCLLDKDRYVVLFDIEGTSLYTTSGMVLFFKLKPAKEQKLIKDNKKINKKKAKNNFDNLSGSCFIFTNNNGRIVSLSRGFEDFFHLKYEVLRENHLNVKDIFKIEKLDEKGTFKTTLIKVYDNIIDIFNEKIGLIGEDDFSKLEDWFSQYPIKIYKEESKIKDILELNKTNKGKIDCSLCSTLKKGAVIKAAKKLGCNKVAFAHHGDDAVETLIMNMIYGGRIATFDPKMYLDKSDTTFIRPFCLSFESDIAKTCRQLDIPIIKSGCPNDGYTKRQEVKELLHSIYRKYPQAKENFLLSLYNKEQLNLYLNKLDPKI